jgi:hypothetical protein
MILTQLFFLGFGEFFKVSMVVTAKYREHGAWLSGRNFAFMSNQVFHRLSMIE